MDFLACLSMKHSAPLGIDAAVLNPVVNLPFLERHPTVHAFLDNDKAGMDALDKLEGNLGKDTVLVNESVRLYPRHNDFNEFLQACKKKAMTAGNEM